MPSFLLTTLALNVSFDNLPNATCQNKVVQQKWFDNALAYGTTVGLFHNEIGKQVLRVWKRNR